MNTSETLMTDPTTEEGRAYWEDRRKAEESQERESAKSDLEKLIKDSIEKRDAQEAERKRKEDEEEGEYQSLLAEATEARLAELVDQIPHPLLRYCAATDAPLHHEKAYSIKKLREGWRPDHLRVVAPGLSTIFFDVGAEWDNDAKAWGAPYIRSLSTSAQYRDEHKKWFLAIAAAAALHAQREEWDKKEAEFQAREFARYEARQTPTLAERLAGVVREIARDELSNREE